MKHHFFLTMSAAALSLALIGGPAYSQDLGLKQLQDSATSNMAQLGMDTTMIPQLTLEELSQIQSISSSGDADSMKEDRIDTVLRSADERIASGDVAMPSGPAGDVTAEDLEGDMVVKANVGSYIARLGMQDDVNVDMLSTDELLQIQSIMNSNRDDGEARMAIEQTVLN